MNKISESTILIVDDDDLICQTLYDIFQEKGYKVTIANDGTEAIEKVKQTAFDLTFIDILLPDVDGITLLKQFKKDYPESSYIIITGNATLKTAISALEDGADRYFIKPLPVDKIIERAHEIIENQHLRKRLRESEEKYRLISENANDLISIVDNKWKFQYCNEAFKRILGYDPNVLVGTSSFNIIHPDDRNECFRQIRKSFLNGSTKNEARLKCKDGSYKWVESIGKITYDEDMKFKHLIGISRDITNRKNLEQKLKEVNKLKSEFLRRASHELKTPLISIKGFSDLILYLHKDQLNIEIISKLREITEGCERLQNIINSLIKASKLESPELLPNKKKEDLSFLIKFCVHELESLAKGRNQLIKLEIHDNLYVNIEKEEIHDVLSNLLSNAIKYTPPNGKIEIKTELKEDFVVVSVIDNGIGFTEDQKKKIFQQFGKIDRDGQGLDLGIDGTGLGLYISKRIVELHGGKIWLESEGKNKGSSFYFILPTAK